MMAGMESRAPQPFTLPFLKKEQLAKDIYSFFFNREGYDFTFRPGQFVRMTLTLPEEDPRSPRRYFTISSSPTQKESITITTRVTETPSIFKQKLFSLSEGEEVSFWGPSGSFILPEERKEALVILSGGIGITPFHSMLTSFTPENVPEEVILIASFRRAEEMLFYDELQRVAAILPQVKVIYTLTEEKWSGETGRISEDILRRYLSDIKNKRYYLSGPIPFVKAMLALVQSFGVEMSAIKEDNFPGY